MTPAEVVEQLDQFIVGQNDAKRAVAIAAKSLAMEAASR